MTSVLLPTSTLSTLPTLPTLPTSPTTTYSFHQLVQDIKAHLGNDGIEEDPAHLISLMNRYSSDATEWMRYFHNDLSRGYTRNSIANINGRANLLLLVWNPSKGSPVHDHANAHCIMKILSGQLTETVFQAPEAGESKGPLQIKQESVRRVNETAYISDDIGLHRMWNNGQEVAVSLHLYTPPNAADYGFHIFDEETGQASHIKP
ncbi:hypothetical protein ASPZODRAFT_128920 [Penicilliopsis zonata CBS 506.65]|uniref:Cysteine dioxygenase n=1 Tax=Penicilliopsis zonata CBS 506.65 TaxID=1073090 RepID=A0A1L9SSX9_9EURO|nr:hypothetical protein ASPZODRAFT_128920 [Penicilliopsis zonata CBS 506.65]OJJ50299.1 hypothetical protein ASPZODRAFT_128920 [Penicilliopsis zonata CBS 506.65]